jgi:hypothetical protein
MNTTTIITNAKAVSKRQKATAESNRQKKKAGSKRHGAALVALAILLALGAAAGLGGCFGGYDADTGTDSYEYGDAGEGTTVDLGGSGDGTSAGAVGSDAAAGDTLEAALARGEVEQYDRVVVYDETLGCEAVRSMVPAGWQGGGQVLWNMQSGAYPAVVDFYATTADGTARSGYVSDMAYMDPDPSKGLVEGQYDDNWQPRPVKAYNGIEAYIQETLATYFGVASVEVLDVKYPEGEDADFIADALQQVQAQADAQQEQANASTPYAQGSTKAFIDCAQVTARFDLNGVSYKAEAGCMVLGNDFTLMTQDLYNTYQTTDRPWIAGAFTYYAAEESLFETYYDDSLYFQNNRIVNQQWRDAIAQTAQAIFEQNAQVAQKNFQQIQQQIQQQAAQSAASSSPNYSYTSTGSSSGSGYDSSVMDGWTNAITGNSYYEAPDGGSVLLDYNDYHYTDGTSIYSSDTPLNIGGTNLSELNDLGTMGGD